VAKVIIELEEADFMEVLSTLIEVKDTLVRIEKLLSTNHSITGMERINTNLEKLMTRGGDPVEPDTST
jgi:5-bromo-4-chloroindolyl phosphate hydrolysis protein